jgi:hypothetical protein
MNWALFLAIVLGGLAAVWIRGRRPSQPPQNREAIERSEARAGAHFLVLVALYAAISTAYLVGKGGPFAGWSPLRVIAVVGLPVLCFFSLRAAVRIYRAPRGS